MERPKVRFSTSLSDGGCFVPFLYCKKYERLQLYVPFQASKETTRLRVHLKALREGRRTDLEALEQVRKCFSTLYQG